MAAVEPTEKDANGHRNACQTRVIAASAKMTVIEKQSHRIVWYFLVRKSSENCCKKVVHKIVGLRLACHDRRHCLPVRLLPGGCSFQFGRTSTRLLWHTLHLIRPVKLGTVVSAGQTDTSSRPLWRHSGLRQETNKFCTPRARMSPRVIGGPCGCLGLEAMVKPARNHRSRDGLPCD